MAFDLECAADAEKSGAELVFQPGVDAFGHGAEIVDQVVEVGHVDELRALDLAAPFGLALVVGAKVALDDGGVAERPALVVDRGGPEFCREVQPPASLKGLDIPSRRAVFVPWKPSRRPAFGMGNPTFR